MCGSLLKTVPGRWNRVIAKGADNPARDFHRFITASAYHLARYSARAFSTLTRREGDPNMTEAETCLSQLMLRDIDGLEGTIKSFKARGEGEDGALIEQLNALDPLDTAGEIPGDEATDDLDDAEDPGDITANDILNGRHR